MGLFKKEMSQFFVHQSAIFESNHSHKSQPDEADYLKFVELNWFLLNVWGFNVKTSGKCSLIKQLGYLICSSLMFSLNMALFRNAATSYSDFDFIWLML